MTQEQEAQTQEEEIQVSVVEEQPAPVGEPVASEEELDQYTKKVSKRINKKNQQIRAEKQRADEAVRMIAERDAEIMALRNHSNTLNQNLFVAEEQSVQAKEQQADELYKKAVASGDAELMSKADTLKSDLSIQKEKLRVAKNRQSVNEQQVAQQPVQQQTVQQEAPKPTREALDWSENNPWYGDQDDPKNAEASQYAYFTHFNLINEGYEPDSNDYYEELDTRISNVYPDMANNKKAETREDRPSVQRVTSASVGSRQKTQGKKNGVTFSKSEVDRLRGLKPYNMSEDEWLKRVAKEKQKISQRETV
jgi:hypothetical protein|tara:strand:- start:112 stop:1035 length:924 start_codon:yes stop_codon:yes gene_type:complete